MNPQLLSDFVSYCATHITGDEKGEVTRAARQNLIKDLHHALDRAVAEAYGFPDMAFFKKQTGLYLDDPNPVLEFLLALNLSVAEKEAKVYKGSDGFKPSDPYMVLGPGLPGWVENKEEYVTEDCVRWEG